jgi:hypothetical protein
MKMTKHQKNEGGKTKLPLAQLKQFISDEIALLPDWDEKDDQAALVMLAALSIGTRDPEAISRYTGVPVTLIREFYARIEENAMLRPGELAAAAWLDPKNGQNQFILDVWVATGKLRRAKQRVGVVPSGKTIQ